MIDQEEHSNLVTEGIEDYRREHGLDLTPNDQLVRDGECVLTHNDPECRHRQKGGMCPHIIGQIVCKSQQKHEMHTTC